MERLEAALSISSHSQLAGNRLRGKLSLPQGSLAIPLHAAPSPLASRGNHVGTCRREKGLSPLQFLQESSNFCFMPEPLPSVMREFASSKGSSPMPSAHRMLLPSMHSSFCRAAYWVQFFWGCTYLYKISGRSVVGALKRQ